MSLAAWLYAIGISAALTAAIVWAAKALHCFSRPRAEALDRGSSEDGERS